MEKVVFVGYSSPDATGLTPGEATALNQRLVASLDGEKYPDLALQVEDEASTAKWQRRQRPEARRVVATISAWTECGDDVADLRAVVAETLPDHVGFVVTESIPRWRVPRSTSPSEPRPGVTVTSLLTRSQTMSREEFVTHWRLVHQPMSLRIHPQWTYVRNVVARPVTPDPPPIDAICEEGFASVDDVLDPARFFGGDPSTTSWQENAATIGDDVRLFLDTDHTTATITREYRLRDFRRGDGVLQE